MEPPRKTRKLIIKLKQMSFVGTALEELRERILDNRIKKCRVQLQRVRPTRNSSIGISGRQTRRCCVRLPRFNYVSRSEIASTPSSSIVHRDSFEDDFLQDTA